MPVGRCVPAPSEGPESHPDTPVAAIRQPGTRGR